MVLTLSFCLGIGWGSSSISAQGKTIVQLRNEVSLLQEKDSLWIDMMNQISWEFSNVNYDSSEFYARQALARAELLNYQKGTARAYNLIAIIYGVRGKNKESQRLNELALPIARESGDSFVLSVVLNDLAIDYNENNEQEKSLNYYLESLDYTPGMDTIGQLYTNGNIALLYLNIGYDSLAAKYLKAALDVSGTSTDPYISVVYKSVEVDYHYISKEYEKALKSIEEGYQLATQYKHHQSEIDFLQRAAFVHSELGNIEAALLKLDAAEALYQKYGIPQNEGDITIEKMKILLKEEQFQTVINLGESRLPELDTTLVPFYTLSTYHEILATAYSKLGAFKKAFQHQEQFTIISDSLYKSEISGALAKLDHEYELGKKEAENLLLKEQQQQDARSLRNHRYLNLALSTIIFLIGAIGFLVWRASREKIRYNSQLEKDVALKTADLKARNEDLEGFTHIVSHDFKEPIRNIVSFINLIERKEAKKLSKDTQDYFFYIQKSAKQLHALVDDVLQFTKVGKSQIKRSDVDLNLIIEDVAQNLKLLIEEKNATIDYDQLPSIHASSAHLHLILKNLIENGLVYNKSSNPIIKISYRWKNNKHQLWVEDNGIGVPVEYQARIFNMFYRLYNREEFPGTGMGLAIVKKLTDRLDGTIEVEAGAGEMSTRFCLEFP